MKTPEQIMSEAKSKVAEATKQAELVQYVLDSLDGRPAPDSVSHFVPSSFHPKLSYRGEWRKHKTFQDVLDLLDLFPPCENYWVIKKTCTSVTLESLCDPDELDKYGNMIAKLDLRFKGFDQTLEWSWGTKLGDKTFEVEVTTAASPLVTWKPVGERKNMRTGELLSVDHWRLDLPRIPTEKYATIRWASGDYKNQRPNDFSIMFQPWFSLEDIKQTIKAHI